MANLLTTGTSSGTQTSTQSPQTSAGETSMAARGGAVQPGTATNLLNSDKTGISLKGQSLSVVNLGARHSQVSTFTPPPQKHTSPVLFGVSGLLFIIAAVMVWTTIRSAKITT